jgi:hypothetical protein
MAFRTDRLSRIVNNEIPVFLKQMPRLVLHLLPLASFAPGCVVDIKSLRAMPGSPFAPMKVISSYGSQYNFDGLACFERFHDNSSVGYTQVFRTGCIEVVDVSLLTPSGDRKVIYGQSCRQALVEYLPELLRLEKFLGVTPPFVLALSFLRVRGYDMSPGERWISAMTAHPIDRDDLLLPDALLEESSDNASALLKPAFDALYNACGYAES